jgi:formamidopyrimidine-DNA glycosylase
VPELIEVEMYRRAAELVVGRVISDVDAHDGWFLKEGTTPAQLHSLIGDRFVATRRIGKLLVLTTALGTDLGLRFGMTGRLVIDGSAAIDELLYSSHRDDPTFVRFRIRFADGGRMEVSDPRRLGGVAIDPRVNVLGPDAAVVTLPELTAALRDSSAPIKARLLEQSRLAGVGNLIADEVLWRAGISPMTSSASLRGVRLRRLHDVLVSTIADLQQRGGSHLGDLMAFRSKGGHCPKCGVALRVEQVGGRTTYWCPKHQR